jgi:hypothetical protein
MTADGQRIASLERQVAGLSARVEQLARQAFVIKTLEGIAVERAGYGSTGATKADISPPVPCPSSCRLTAISSVHVSS